MVMEPISIEHAKRIAAQKRLMPGKVRGTNGIQFTRGNNSRIQPISWDEFERLLRQRGLQVYESSGWMKIMKR